MTGVPSDGWSVPLSLFRCSIIRQHIHKRHQQFLPACLDDHYQILIPRVFMHSLRSAPWFPVLHTILANYPLMDFKAEMGNWYLECFLAGFWLNLQALYTALLEDTPHTNHAYPQVGRSDHSTDAQFNMPSSTPHALSVWPHTCIPTGKLRYSSPAC